MATEPAPPTNNPPTDNPPATLAPRFKPPGPGGWLGLGDHFPRPTTPAYRRIYAETCPPGTSASLARYGVPARTVEVAFVNGHLYLAPIPLVGPRGQPRPLVWLLVRLHPAFRARTRAARRALAERPWRAAAEQWFACKRSSWRERCLEVQAVEPATLTRRGLADHLDRCRTLVGNGYRRHFELHGDDLLPVGLLLDRAAEWGITPTTATAALRGATAPVEVKDPEPWQLITGYDLDSLAWSELDHDMTARATAGLPVGEPLDLRPLLAPAHHDELAILVADARAAAPLRDDNGRMICAWPMGLLRRAMLAAGGASDSPIRHWRWSCR